MSALRVRGAALRSAGAGNMALGASMTAELGAVSGSRRFAFPADGSLGAGVITLGGPGRARRGGGTDLSLGYLPGELERAPGDLADLGTCGSGLGGRREGLRKPNTLGE
ncbi:hypothetical protein HDU67_004399, partial [Dinochytrium kinnereticum]